MADSNNHRYPMSSSTTATSNNNDDSDRTYPPHLPTQSFLRPRMLAQPIDLSILGAIFFWLKADVAIDQIGWVVDIQRHRWIWLVVMTVFRDWLTTGRIGYYHVQIGVPSNSSGFTLICWASALMRLGWNLPMFFVLSLDTAFSHSENVQQRVESWCWFI